MRALLSGRLVAIVLLPVILSSCGGDSDSAPPPVVVPPSPLPPPTPTPPTPSPAPVIVTIGFDFTDMTTDFFVDNFAEFSSATNEATIDYTAGLAAVPLSLSGEGYLQSSQNRSDDIFMYLWRPVTGLSPDQDYRVTAEITFATNIPPGCAGIGGDPGDGVIIQAGGAAVEPMRIATNPPGSTDNFIGVNFAHGTQDAGDMSGFNIGTFAQTTITGSACDNSDPYSAKTVRHNSVGPLVRADGQGSLWLFMGTDSGFEGLTQIYWLSGNFTLTPE